MIEFLLKVLITIIMFIILFAATHNINIADVVHHIIEAAKEFWTYVTSFWGNDDPMNPYL